MSSYDNYHDYTPIEYGTPTKSSQNTPVSTPSRAALLRPNIMSRGSPIKFKLPKSTRKPVKKLYFDPDYDEPEAKPYRIRRAILRVSLVLLWICLNASAIYLSVLYIRSAALTVLRWSNQYKVLFRMGLAINTLGAGFSIGYLITRQLRFPSTPWRTTLDSPRELLINWVMFLIFLIGIPIAATVIPFILGRSGQFNPEYHAWNNACMESSFTSMLQIKYIATIGYAFSINIYARSADGTYYYLGLLPSTPPEQRNAVLSTPNFILHPTINPINGGIAAGRRMFSLIANSTDTELIASLSLNATETGGQSISAMCTASNNPAGNLTNCVDGFLTSSAQTLTGDGESKAPNPFLLASGNRTKTIEIMYTLVPDGTNALNATFVRGFAGSWPNATTSYMTGDVAVGDQPSGILEEDDSDGKVVFREAVQVVNSPWPGCQGLKVCATSGVNALIATGWIWENLDKWMWYSPEDCQA